MAQQQCPNCGGYKTYSWRSRFLTDICIGIVASLCFMGLPLLVVIPWWLTLWFKRPEGGMRSGYCCEICNNQWDTARTTANSRVRPDLIALGNDLLERQRAAAAEEERSQEEQRQWYGNR